MSLTDIVSKTDNQFQEDVSNTPETIFVLTNFKKHFGASCILYTDALKNFCKEKNMDGVYMIPSSVLEFKNKLFEAIQIKLYRININDDYENRIKQIFNNLT